MSYVIRNCPACRQYQVGIYTCDDLYDCDLQRCQDCTDCVLKQIVSRLNNFAEDYGLDAGFYADELLSYLDIQEVE